MGLFSVVADVTMSPQIPLRPISMRVVLMNPFFVEVALGLFAYRVVALIVLMILRVDRAYSWFMKLYVTRDVGIRLKPPVESGFCTSVLVAYVHDYEDCFVTVKLLFHLGLDGVTESQEGICVSFSCHALKQVWDYPTSSNLSASSSSSSISLHLSILPSRSGRLFQVLVVAVVIFGEMSWRLNLLSLQLGLLRREFIYGSVVCGANLWIPRPAHLQISIIGLATDYWILGRDSFGGREVVWVGLVFVDSWVMGFYGGKCVRFAEVSVAEFSCGADLKRSFGWVSFVGVAIGLRYFIVVDVVVFLVLSVIDLEFWKSICGTHFRRGTVWTVLPRLLFRAWFYRLGYFIVVDMIGVPGPFRD
ncbi:hypothetical protein GIB67_014296 [Kingdonia uniflora]|uniref:Transmembrane protein n=1 Tax=Kingdonia uniflora TaxID=39325 RepID=A0A7J7M223_9MAGN|nr:hypothetical protein GIB67_014296 [Kingdonia uniflora]